MKICTKCGGEKDICEFYKKTNKETYFAECKTCNNKRNNEYKNKNKEKINKQKQKYRDSEYGKNIAAIYFQRNKIKISDYYRERRRDQNYKKNLSIKVCEYSKMRKIYDIHYRNLLLFRNLLKTNLRSFKYKKKNRSLDYLGCDIKFFKEYLESKFQTGMNWENQGKEWCIDHILPCELFDLSKEKQIFICFHYTNLNPEWKIINIKKSDLLPDRRRARNLTKEEKLEYLKTLGFDL